LYISIHAVFLIVFVSAHKPVITQEYLG